MASLVQISEDDPWLVVATYIGETLGGAKDEGEGTQAKVEADNFVDKFKQAYENEQFEEVLDLFVSKFDSVCQVAENDHDLEGIMNIMCHLVPRLEPKASVAAAEQLASGFCSDPKTRPERRLQGLINLYNTVLDTSSKFAILQKTVEFSRASGLADIMLGVIKTNIDSWVSALHLSKEDSRALYINCAQALGSCTRKPKTAARESYRLKIKALGTFDKGNSDSGVDIAAQVVSEFLASKDLYSFDFFQNPVVQALKSSPEHKALFEMLDAYLNGSVNQFAQFLKNAGAEVISKLGVTEEEATTKMRLLALAGLANNRSSLTFNEVSTSLDIPTSDVEDIIVKAIGKHLLEAKINQLNETVIISKCYSRKFEDEEWKNLQADMKQWRSTIKHILELGADNKAVLAKGFSELQLYA